MIKVFTDTDTDITLSEANELNLGLISMPYIINDKEIRPYEDFEVFNVKEFYDILRKGVLPTITVTNFISKINLKLSIISFLVELVSFCLKYSKTSLSRETTFPPLIALIKCSKQLIIYTLLILLCKNTAYN